MFSPPPFTGRKPLASRVRSWLYAHTPYGYYLDVAQASCSAISCILFIVVSYSAMEPLWVTDTEVRRAAAAAAVRLALRGLQP